MDLQRDPLNEGLCVDNGLILGYSLLLRRSQTYGLWMDSACYASFPSLVLINNLF